MIKIIEIVKKSSPKARPFVPIFTGFMIVLVTTAVQAATFTTQASGEWHASSTWSSGAIPQGPSGDPDIRINHDVTLDGSIHFTQNNPKFTIAPGVTLIVTGSLEFTRKLSLTINSGGRLIIAGNFGPYDGMSASVNGDLIVLGDFDAGNNTDVNINGGGTIVSIGEYTSGTGNINGGGSMYVLDDDPVCNTSNSQPGDHPCQGNISNYFSTMSDLQNLEPDIYDIVNGALPVTLRYFKVNALHNGYNLLWSTASEENLDYFAIERSDDGRTFTQIGIVKGGGWSGGIRNYQFTDGHPAAGVNYYRLKAVDYDGYTEYFPLASAVHKVPVIRITNPASGGWLVIQSPAAGSVRLVNALGVEVYYSALTAGVNRFDVSGVVSSGYYIAVIRTEAGIAEKEKVYFQ